MQVTFSSACLLSLQSAMMPVRTSDFAWQLMQASEAPLERVSPDVVGPSLATGPSRFPSAGGPDMMRLVTMNDMTKMKIMAITRSSLNRFSPSAGGFGP